MEASWHLFQRVSRLAGFATLVSVKYADRARKDLHLLRPLYLDSARLGQLAPSARQALDEFLNFVGTTPTHPRLVEWLRTGEVVACESNCLPAWPGVKAFEQSVAKMFGASACSRVFVASRSIALIRLALQQLFKRCRRCMTVDTCWPRYLQELHRASNENSDSVFVKSFRRPVYDRGVSVEEFCENMCLTYCSEGCDGLFLPAVDHLGTRIPVAQIVRTIQSFDGEIRFVVIDAAQALGHVPLDDDCQVADFLIAGTHKWLGSYSTLGLGIAPQATSLAAIECGIQQALRCTFTDDGLLAFVEQLRDSANIQSETVNLCPLISAFGALESTSQPTAATVTAQLRNAEQVIRIAELVGWNAELPDSDLRSGILLLQLPRHHQHIPASQLQQVFADQMVYLTAYDRGLIRLSLPTEPLSHEALVQLEQALTSAKGGKSREIPVRHDLQTLLCRYLQSCQPSVGHSSTRALFTTANRNTKRLTERPITADDIGRMVKRRLAAIGLPARLSPHSFRVATITDLLEQGVPLENVQVLAGHADPRTTRLYDRRQKKITRNIVERISI